MKKVKVRMTVDYEIEVPESWGEEQIEFSRNEAIWCASNAIEELEVAFGDESDKCMCDIAEFQCLGSATDPNVQE